MEIASEIKKNKKTLKTIVSFTINKILKKTENDSVNNTLESFKKLAENYLTDDKVLETIEVNPEFLFEFFDNQKIFIGIECEQASISNRVIFKYRIHNMHVIEKNSITDSNFLTRREVNTQAIIKAVELLNEYNLDTD